MRSLASVVPKSYANSPTHAPPKRGSIQHWLLVIGLPHARCYATNSDRARLVRRHGTAHRTTGFWAQSDEALQALAVDMRTVFHARLKQVGHDHVANHEQAVALLGAYARAKQLFAAHGIVCDRA